MKEKSIALVGRPNVGKSRLFNRLLGRRASIVHDRPGVTRDIVLERLGENLMLMDTGGIGATFDMAEKVIADATSQQAEFAILAADGIVFVVDSQDGLTPLDQEIASTLRKSGKPVILAINKIDVPAHSQRAADFYKLGFSDSVEISAEHGYGLERLEGIIERDFGHIDPHAPDGSENRIKICVAGRPNVGKSSICNRMLGEERLIVSDVAGTTRDSVACDIDVPLSPEFDFLKKSPSVAEIPVRTDSAEEEIVDEDDVIMPSDEKTSDSSANYVEEAKVKVAEKIEEKPMVKFRLFDTAGLRVKRKINTSLDFLSSERTRGAIKKCDVVFLVIDAMDGVSELDKKLAGEILAEGASIAVVVNKWDYALETFRESPLRGYKSIIDFKKSFDEAVRKNLYFVGSSPISFVSAKANKGISGLFVAAAKLREKMNTNVGTGKLNTCVSNLIEKSPPPSVSGKRFKVYYVVKTAVRPFTIRLYCNTTGAFTDSYKRYLENGIRKKFDLGGVSIKIEAVGKPKQTPEARIDSKSARGIFVHSKQIRKSGKTSGNAKKSSFSKIPSNLSYGKKRVSSSKGGNRLRKKSVGR